MSIPDRWVRIHSLPESKRYPESLRERQEILRRHNAVADYVLGDGPCILFFASFLESKKWLKSIQNMPAFEVLNTFAPEHLAEIVDEDESIQLFGTRQVWRSGKFDKLILECAEDHTGCLLFANVEKGTAYAPYDGGADLFLDTSEAIAATRQEFKDWLPSTESGL